MIRKQDGKAVVICITIILVLIGALVGMWYYYNYIRDAEGVEVSKETPKEEEKVVIKALNINDRLVQDLYEYVLKFNYNEEVLVYQKDKVTFEDMDNQLKLLTVFAHLDKEDAEKIEATEFTGVEEDDGKSYMYLFTEEQVEDKLKEIFGEDASVKHEDCPPWDGYAIEYDEEEGIYTCYEYAGGGDVLFRSYAILLEAEQEGDYLYIYDQFVHLVANEDGTTDLYATSDRKVLIIKDIDLEEEGLYDGMRDSDSDEEYERKFNENLLKICGDDAKTFKHTFKKNSNGDYYWVSTEIKK